ncbi:AAA family ATPase [Vibrio alfacsensis]|uniref:AAA family ATPase n=1 Tax=Vibrio alfacsensis TaxID=1074311 RepID=UPI0040691FAE
MLLNNVTLQGKSIDLTDARDHDDANVVTILMGNNGSGKSRLFQTICSTFIQAPRQNMMGNYLRDVVNFSNLEDFDSLSYFKDGEINFLSRFKEPFFKRYIIGNEDQFIDLVSIYPYKEAIKLRINNVDDATGIDYIIPHFINEAKEHSKHLKLKRNGVDNAVLNEPSKVLAVTGSPYDKFPFRDTYSSQDSLAPYIYFGTREKRQAGARFNRGYLRYKFDQLGASFIKLLLKPKQEYFDFSKMFDFLDISHSFTLKLSLSERIRKEEVSQDAILNVVRSVQFFKDKNHEEISEEKERAILSKRLVDALTYVADGRLDEHESHRNPLEILCKIDLGNESKDKKLLNSLALLSEYDLVELDDVMFTKSKPKQDFLLSQASSGELSLLFTMSSIAGEIENGSLILIDEPELSLHPEWQLNFLSLLTDIFSNYKSCHFIIATHSPNLISSIPDNNAYIVSLDDDKAMLLPSEMYHNRSADFQLASVFNAPGNNNEYLLSQVIEVLDSLCKSNEPVDNSLIRAKWLLSFESKLEEGDKVKVLLGILKETMEALSAR